MIARPPKYFPAYSGFGNKAVFYYKMAFFRQNTDSARQSGWTNEDDDE
jgi:hypothetical protein